MWHLPDKDLVQPRLHGAGVGGEPQEVLLAGCGEDRKVRDRAKSRVAAGCDRLDEELNKDPLVVDLERVAELCKG